MTSSRVEEELQELNTEAEKRALRIQRAQSLKLMLKEIVETVAFILLVFFILRAMMQNYKIEGSSMEPNLHNNQYIWVNKLAYFHVDLNAPLRILPGKHSLPRKVIYPFLRPRRGDVIVFERVDAHDRLIKRVIGLPGDHVEIRDGKPYVNGELLDEPYIPTSTTCVGDPKNCDMTVPEHTIYVLGDNRPNSADSRTIGAVDLEVVTGKAWIIYWPREHWGIIGTPTYAIDQH